jgi:hypothetical protein
MFRPSGTLVAPDPAAPASLGRNISYLFSKPAKEAGPRGAASFISTKLPTRAVGSAKDKVKYMLQQ